MVVSIALRSFDHGGNVAKGDDVSDRFDIYTLRALKRSGLVSLQGDGEHTTAKTEAPKAPVPTVGSLGKAPQPKVKDKVPKAPKAGKKSPALPVAPALPPLTSTPSTPGDLPPPLPVASS